MRLIADPLGTLYVEPGIPRFAPLAAAGSPAAARSATPRRDR